MSEAEKVTRKVERGLVAFDELPPAPVRTRNGSGGRVSEFDVLLDELHKAVTDDPNLRGKPVSMSRYENETGAKAAANVLRQRNGRTMAATGHEFVVRSVTDSAGKQVWHLFVKYDPSEIEDGAWEAHVKAEQVRIEGVEKKRQEKADAAEFGGDPE